MPDDMSALYSSLEDFPLLAFDGIKNNAFVVARNVRRILWDNAMTAEDRATIRPQMMRDIANAFFSTTANIDMGAVLLKAGDKMREAMSSASEPSRPTTCLLPEGEDNAQSQTMPGSRQPTSPDPYEFDSVPAISLQDGPVGPTTVPSEFYSTIVEAHLDPYEKMFDMFETLRSSIHYPLETHKIVLRRKYVYNHHSNSKFNSIESLTLYNAQIHSRFGPFACPNLFPGARSCDDDRTEHFIAFLCHLNTRHGLFPPDLHWDKLPAIFGPLSPDEAAQAMNRAKNIQHLLSHKASMLESELRVLDLSEAVDAMIFCSSSLSTECFKTCGRLLFEHISATQIEALWAREVVKILVDAAKSENCSILWSETMPLDVPVACERLERLTAGFIQAMIGENEYGHGKGIDDTVLQPDHVAG
jgi:hypothetical protein